MPIAWPGQIFLTPPSAAIASAGASLIAAKLNHAGDYRPAVRASIWTVDRKAGA